MTNKQIAAKLVKFCETKKFTEGRAELYAENVLSIEADNSKMTGLAALIEKQKNWLAPIKEINKVKCSDIVTVEKFISMKISWEITYFEKGKVKWEEIAVYQIENGKIILEKFYY